MPRVARTRRFPAARRHGPAGVVFAAPSPDALDAPAVGTLISAFGLGVRLADAGLIGLGILALRQRRWSPGWAVLSLALGVFRLLVVTPVSLAAGFFSVASNVAISIAHVLTALIGVRLLHRRAPRSPLRRAASSVLPG